jgi:hypothetical protein
LLPALDSLPVELTENTELRDLDPDFLDPKELGVTSEMSLNTELT